MQQAVEEQVADALAAMREALKEQEAAADRRTDVRLAAVEAWLLNATTATTQLVNATRTSLQHLNDSVADVVVAVEKAVATLEARLNVTLITMQVHNATLAIWKAQLANRVATNEEAITALEEHVAKTVAKSEKAERRTQQDDRKKD